MRVLDLLDPTLPFSTRLQELTESSDQAKVFQGQKLAELVHLIQKGESKATVFASLYGREIWIRGNRRSVKVWIDWPDYSPLVDGLPNAHYRIEIKVSGRNSIVREERVATTEEAAIIVNQILPV